MQSPEAIREGATGNRGRAVELHIEELVLHGFAHVDRQAIAEAVQHELAQMILRSGSLPQVSGHVDLKQIDGGIFQIQRGAGPEKNGVQIARSVFKGMRQHMRVAAKSGVDGRGTKGRQR